MIKRSNPDIGYYAPELFAQAGVSQVVRAGSTVHIAGIVAARGAGELVCADLRGQMTFVLDILGKCLAHERLDMSNLAAVTIYCRDINALAAESALLADAFRAHPPAMTWIEVKSLNSPDYLLELVATAHD